MPAWNADETIARTLRSLRNAPEVERIVVVVSGSERAAVSACGFARVDVVALRDRASAGRARNLGRRRAANARLLLFVDADCALAPGSVAALIERLRTDELAAAGAAIVPEGGGAVGSVRHLLEFKESDPRVTLHSPWFLPSAALLVRADAFDAAGGFPDMWPGEDLVLCSRLAAGGGRIEKVTDAIAYHYHPGSLRAFLSHQLRLGRTSAQARMMCDIPGTIFVGRLWLAPALWLARLARALGWMLRYRALSWARTLSVMPLVAAGLSAWTLGFAAARSPSADRGETV